MRSSPEPEGALGESDLRRMGVHAAAAAAVTVQRSGADLPYRHEFHANGRGMRDE